MSPMLFPIQQLKRLGDAGQQPVWRATGNDPFFDVAIPGGRLKGGWYLLTLEVEVLRGRMHMPALYPDYARGHVLESDSLAIPLSDARKGRHTVRRLVRFVADVSALRFDPTVLPGDFRVLRLDLEKQDKLSAGRLMFASQWNEGSMRERAALLRRVCLAFLRGGPRGMAERLYADYAAVTVSALASDYEIWTDIYDDCSPESIDATLAAMPKLMSEPLFSVVMPTYNTDVQWLAACIDSVIAQTYANWELCIADDASTDDSVWALIERYASTDSRIKAVRRQVNGHIAAASNSALALATGDYVALLDHDDALHPLALQWCALGFERNPRWRMLFTDEDKIDTEGVRSDPYFKSDWNPDLFLSQNCVCHLAVYERELLDAIGGFREGVNGSQDWDLALRATERLGADQIGHIQKVLYHWRIIEGSTALGAGEKTYAHGAGRQVIVDHLDRIGVNARVEERSDMRGHFHVVRAVDVPEPSVTLLIPTRDRVDLLKQCIDSIIERTTYENYEIVVLDNGSVEPETQAYLAKVTQRPNVRVLAYDAPFNYSKINNFGAKHSSGQVIGLLNNDIEVISPGWLTEMVSHAMRKEIGVVGAMLYYPNDTIQHAGVVLGIGGVAGHSYVGVPRNYPGDKFRAKLVQNVSAVTAACAVVRREVFEAVGGLDEAIVVAFNDVDFCIRVREAGYRNLWTPLAELYHHESASRGYENTPEKVARFNGEVDFMLKRWGDLLKADPYYNPNFTLSGTPFTLSYPPR